MPREDSPQKGPLLLSEPPSTPPSDTGRRRPKTEIIVLIENPKKNTPLGPILRCLSACGIQQLWTVGYDQCTNVQGAHGADKHVQMTGFPTAEQAVAALSRTSHNFDGTNMSTTTTTTPATTHSVTIIGLLGALPNGYNNEQEGYPVVVLHTNDTDNNNNNDDTRKNLAVPVLKQPTNQHQHSHRLGLSYPVYALPPLLSVSQSQQEAITENNILCLVISKDRTLGLPRTLARHCHVFCHVPCIPLHVSDTSSSSPPVLLDAPSTVTITLQHLITRLGDQYVYHEETQVQGHKFSVADPPLARRRNQQQRQHSQNSPVSYKPNDGTTRIRIHCEDSDNDEEDQQGETEARLFFWGSCATPTTADNDGDY